MADHDRSSTALSRRRVLQLGIGAVGATLIPGAAGTASASPAAPAPATAAELRNSLRQATEFLGIMMDAYAQGNTLRLVQSYQDGSGLQSTAFTYDNALTIIAFLQSRETARARVLGDSLLYAQQNDPNYSDGRLRQAYFVNQNNNGVYIRLALDPFYFVGSAVGDMAWAAIALTQLFAKTGEQRYLDGAVRLGQWIVDNAYDTRGPGGYSFGRDGNNNPVLVKATEHNIDVYGLFTMLAKLTRDATWTARAEHARTFLEAMWNAERGFFWTGTTEDGATINTFAIPEDAQTWSYQSLLDNRFAASIDWAKTNLSTTDTPQTINSSLTGNIRIQGVTFSDLSLRALQPSSQYDPAPNPNGVWLEGTAQLAAALLTRNRKAKDDLPSFDGDKATAEDLFAQIQLAQAALGKNQTAGGKSIPEGKGIVAATSVVNTGYGFSYFPNLHIGATSWYIIAGTETNPFRIIK